MTLDAKCLALLRGAVRAIDARAVASGGARRRLECSRPGAAAVAWWPTHRLLRRLGGGRLAKLEFLACAPRTAGASATSTRTQEVFAASAASGSHLAAARRPRSIPGSAWTGLHRDEAEVACPRSCPRKPSHLDRVDRIVEALGRAAG